MIKNKEPAKNYVYYIYKTLALPQHFQVVFQPVLDFCEREGLGELKVLSVSLPF